MSAADNLYRAIVLYFEGQDDDAYVISDALFQYEVTLRERGIDPEEFCGLAEGKCSEYRLEIARDYNEDPRGKS